MQNLLYNGVLQCFTSLEHRNLGCGNFNWLLCLGVAAQTSCTALNFKGTKTDQLDLFLSRQSGGDSVQSSGNDGLGIFLGDIGLFGGQGNKFSLVHSKKSSCA